MGRVFRLSWIGIASQSLGGDSRRTPSGGRLAYARDDLVDIVLGDRARGLIELRDQPTHDPGQVADLLVFDRFDHASVAACPLPTFPFGIAAVSFGPLPLPLRTTDPAHTHGNILLFRESRKGASYQK